MSKSNGMRIQLYKYNSETKKSLNTSNSLLKTSRNKGSTISKNVKTVDSNSDSIEISAEKFTYASHRYTNMPRKPRRINILGIKNCVNSNANTPRENSPSSDNKRHSVFNAANDFLNNTTRSLQKLKKMNFNKFMQIEKHIPYIIKFLKFNDFKNMMNSGKRMRLLIDSEIRKKTYYILKTFQQIKDKLQIINSKYIYTSLRSNYLII
jgi:hypothetical protein